MGAKSGWTRWERARIDRLKSPRAIQDFLDRVPYSTDAIYRSPREVLRDRRAHCVDGALFAAAALRRLGRPPKIVWIHAENDDGHLLALWERGGLHGAIAKSNCVGLRFREPVYRSLRELVMSYFNEYFNTRGELTMRAYTMPLDLSRFDRLDWEMNSLRLGVIIDDALDRQRAVPIAPRAMLRALDRVDERTRRAGMMGANKRGLFKAQKG
jgi:hypothetical protein